MVVQRTSCKHGNNHYLIFQREYGSIMLTLKQKRQVGKYLRANHSVYNIRFGIDGAVTANRDGKCGRFFMGWSNQLLQEATQRQGAY